MVRFRALIFYILLQVPGYMFLGVIIIFAMERSWISGITAWIVILAWVAKDVLLYPLYKNALIPGPQDVISRLHGREARVTTALGPEGQVGLRGEIWQARNLDGDTIEPGTRVVVEGNKGLTLEVRRKEL